MVASDAIFMAQFIFPVLLSLTLLFFLSLISARQLFTLYVTLVPSFLLGDRLDNMLLIFRNVFLDANPKSFPGAARFFEAKWQAVLATVRDILTWPEDIWFSRQFLPFLLIIWISFVVLSLLLLLSVITKKSLSLVSAKRQDYTLLFLVLGSLFAFMGNVVLGKNGIVSGLGFIAIIGVFLALLLRRDKEPPSEVSTETG